MAYTNSIAQNTSSQFDHILQAEKGEALSLPQNFIAAQNGYERAGSDLILSNANGQKILLQDFYLEQPSGIEQGSGFISFNAALKLAGPLNPGEYAQATASATSEDIGQIETAEGSVTAVHADGTIDTLEVGSPVFQGDVIRTADGASVGITFKDESTFSLDEGGEMTLDEMVYDPATGDGAFSSTLTSGVFSFVSGQIAKVNPDAMSITTPVATIGIRGTQGIIKQDSAGPMEVALMEEAGGFTGELVLTNSGGSITLNQPNQFSAIISFTSSPSQPIILNSIQITGAFGNKITQILNRTRERAQERRDEEKAEEKPNEEPTVVAAKDPLENTETTSEEDVLVEVDIANLFTNLIADLEDVSNGDGGNGVVDIINKIIKGFEEDLKAVVTQTTTNAAANLEDAISNLEDFVSDSTNANDTLEGNSGTDVAEGIAGFIGNDTIHGYGGNDVISGGYGNDEIYGGSGDDFIHGDVPGADDNFKDIVAHFGSLIDANDGSSYDSTASGYEGRDDFIYGGDGNDVIDGGEGNDYIEGNENEDTISGGSGDDQIYGDDSGSEGGGWNDTLYGDAGLDTLFGGGGNDILYGGDDNDILYGDEGNDTLYGGDGADIMFANQGHNILYGGTGNDIFNGGTGNDTFYGGAGYDILNDSDGSDIIFGGDDNDTLYVVNDISTDTFDGGSGTDILSIDSVDFAVTVNITAPNTGSITSSAGGTDGFTNFETIKTLSYADTFNLQSGGSVDSIDSGSGVDTFNINGGTWGIVGAGAGNDEINVNSNFTGVVNGEGGLDTFVINSQFAGTLDGGSEDDVFTFNVASAAGTVTGGSGKDVFTVLDTSSTNGLTIDGGNADNDTMQFLNTVDATIDFASGSTSLSGIDIFDISGANSTANTVSITTAGIDALSPDTAMTIYIHGDANDTVDLNNAFSTTGDNPVTIDGIVFARYTDTATSSYSLYIETSEVMVINTNGS